MWLCETLFIYFFCYVIMMCQRWTLTTESCKSEEPRGYMEWDKQVICDILWKMQVSSCTVKQLSCGRVLSSGMCSAFKVNQHFGGTMSHLQGKRIVQETSVKADDKEPPYRLISAVTLKMVTHSSRTLVYFQWTTYPTQLSYCYALMKWNKF